MPTIRREFLTGVHIGVAVVIPATCVAFLLVVLR